MVRTQWDEFDYGDNFQLEKNSSRYWNISKLIINNFKCPKVQLKDPKFAARGE